MYGKNLRCNASFICVRDSEHGPWYNTLVFCFNIRTVNGFEVMCLPNWQRIQVYQKSDWVIVSLHRPHVLNALNRALLEELNQVLDWLENQKRFRVLIITGTGEKSFSAGADIEEFSKISSAWAAREWLEYVHRIFQRIEDFPIPVIMAVNGYALGGGCELAMCGDIIFAAEHAQFGQPEIDLGFMPGYGGTQRMTRLIGQSMTKYLCMTGEKISAKTAYDLGIVQKVVSSEKLQEEAEFLAERIARKSPTAIQWIKKAINQGAKTDLHTGLSIETAYCALAFQSEDCKEGMRAFLEKRKPRFKGES